jgi:hypothetical protein
MASRPMLLNGIVDTRDQELAQLRRQLEQFDEALRMERLKTGAMEAGIRELRQVTKPLYMALAKIHGMIEEMGVGDSASSGPSDSKWDAVKSRLEPRMRGAIDMLLLQGSMGRKQIAAALKMDYSNCAKNVIGPLIRQGWIVESGGKLMLKEL